MIYIFAIAAIVGAIYAYKKHYTLAQIVTEIESIEGEVSADLTDFIAKIKTIL